MSRETEVAASVSLSALIIIMAAVWDGPVPVLRIYGLNAEASAQRGIFRKECTLPTTVRAQTTSPTPKETTMRFYQQPLDQPPHRFYCGVDLHAGCHAHGFAWAWHPAARVA
jgi:hypothetical protein